MSKQITLTAEEQMMLEIIVDVLADNLRNGLPDSINIQMAEALGASNASAKKYLQMAKNKNNGVA